MQGQKCLIGSLKRAVVLEELGDHRAAGVKELGVHGVVVQTPRATTPLLGAWGPVGTEVIGAWGGCGHRGAWSRGGCGL